MKRKAIVLFFAFCFVWGSFFSASILVALGSTPISIFDKDTKYEIMSILPQGWGFFSKDPRDPIFRIYEADNESFEVQWPNMRAKNLFGLYRYGRAQGVEMGLIMNKIPKEDWVKCEKGQIQSCEKDAMKVKVKNPSPKPLLCGNYYLTREEIVPWSYSKYYEYPTEIKGIVKVDIVCSRR